MFSFLTQSYRHCLCKFLSCRGYCISELEVTQNHIGRNKLLKNSPVRMKSIRLLGPKWQLWYLYLKSLAAKVIISLHRKKLENKILPYKLANKMKGWNQYLFLAKSNIFAFSILNLKQQKSLFLGTRSSNRIVFNLIN